MLKELRKRFILFNVLVITCVLGALTCFILFGSKSSLSAGRLAVSGVLCFALVLIASYIISKYALWPIRQAWQKQLDFTADASHELRTPLTVIKTNLELIMDSPGESVESQMKWLHNIEAEQTRMARLVDDLLTLSRADTGEQSLITAAFLLDETIRNAAVTFGPVCEQKGISLQNDIESPISFSGDEYRISQLIFILLDNAVHYTSPGGSIFLALHRKSRGLELKIQDTGAGISPEDIGRLFDRFYRADHTRQQNPDGAGLGLAIAKWIVEQHKGRISVKSRLGEGTTFLITLTSHPAQA